MASNNQGPWGNGNQGDNRGPQSPWGGGGNRNNGDDFERMLRQGRDKMRTMLPRGLQSPRIIIAALVILIGLWLISGLYRVNPGEQGIELIFGRYAASTEPGLNWNWPTPIGDVETPDISTRYRVEVGFRSSNSGSETQELTEERLMLTGDENIIDIQFVVLWRIRDAQKYLFDIRDPSVSVRNAVEAAMREIVGQTTFEIARTQGRGQVETQAQELAQVILDSYSSGIAIEQVSMQRVDPPEDVIAAFRDVQAARSDKERAVNESQAYFNQITQEAEGQAAQLVRQAEAYKQEKVANANGDTSRFLSVYAEYRQNPELTKRRLYLETMEGIYRGMNKVIIDDDNGALPLFNLNQLLEKGKKVEGTTGNNQSGVSQ